MLGRNTHKNNLNRNTEIVSPRFFCKKGVLKNFIIFTGKPLCRSLSLDKVHGSSLQFIKKDTPAQVFSYEFCKGFKNNYFVDHVRSATSGNECAITSN